MKSQAEPRSFPRLSRVILAAAFVLGALLRLFGGLSLRSVGYDDGVTFLAASGHEGEYQRVIENGTYPAGEWVKASAWKKFIRIERPLCFSRIRSDLADYDVHPPLYFWLLHLWGLAAGLSPLSSALFNLLLFFPTLVLLFRLARSVLGDESSAALAVFAWALSPAVIMVSWVARAYGLLSLWVVLALSLQWRWRSASSPPGWPSAAAFAAVAAAGLLTHYHFALLLAGCFVYSAAVFLPGRRKRFFSQATAVLAGGGIFAALHPHFYLSFLLQRAQAVFARDYSPSPRWEKTLGGFMNFFAGNPLLQKAVLAALLALAIVACVRRCRVGPARPGPGAAFILFFFAWMSFSISALYLLHLSAFQQMGSRYLSLVYPLVAFLPVFLLRALPPGRAWPTAVFCLAFALSGGARTFRFRTTAQSLSDPRCFFAGRRAAVLDNLDRVFLPRAVWNIPDDMPVLAAAQDDLLARPALLSDLRPPGIYLSRVYWPREKEGKEKILEYFRRSFSVRSLPGALSDLGEACAIEERR
jgi:hypothetical protein